ncbi:MAG TPA: hypothetical protein PK514_14725 [Spirochaetota bacterium]|nr:hypothetical protein [Spirochaetota bacterium]
MATAISYVNDGARLKDQLDRHQAREGGYLMGDPIKFFSDLYSLEDKIAENRKKAVLAKIEELQDALVTIERDHAAKVALRTPRGYQIKNNLTQMRG